MTSPPDDRAKAWQLAERWLQFAKPHPGYIVPMTVEENEAVTICTALLSAERELGEARREIAELRDEIEQTEMQAADSMQEAAIERQECADDVCAECGGRAPQYERAVIGPNLAGNFLHRTKNAPIRETLCKASAIWSRARFETGSVARARKSTERAP